MALIVEDGTGKEDANTFVTLDEARSYATGRGITLPVEDTAVEALIINAADFLFMYEVRLKGVRANDEQALIYPRKGVEINGAELAQDAIPATLKKAQLQLVIEGNSGSLTISRRGADFIKRKKTGPLEKEWSEAVYLQYGNSVSYPLVDTYMQPLLRDDAGAVLRTRRI